MTHERIAALPSDDWRTRNPRFQEPQLSRHLQLAELLRAIGQRHGRTAGEVAIAWTLANPNVTGAIVGARNAGQVQGIVGAAELSLSKDDLSEIERFFAANP
jgi:aryl-alcohol dehydrogenase-like predicted oxidoreductase